MAKKETNFFFKVLKFKEKMKLWDYEHSERGEWKEKFWFGVFSLLIEI